MTGIDEESALLKEVRAHLCVKRKKSNAKKLADELALRELALARQNYAFAYVN